jgi:hypothetical protein
MLRAIVVCRTRSLVVCRGLPMFAMAATVINLSLATHPFQPRKDPAMPSPATLHALLDANARFDLSGKGTTNHCPMALIALSEMGASDARLEQFFAHWEQHFALPAATDVPPVARENWLNELGGDNFAGLQRCFIDWMDEMGGGQAGVDQVLQAVLRQIPFAPASGAFHALIRLAYGLASAHVPEIAAGLAYLVVGNLAIPALPDHTPSVDRPEQALAMLSQAMAESRYPGPSIVGRLRAVVADARFAASLRQVAMDSDFLAQLARIAIAAYWQTRDFTVLHMVTGVHAARLLFARLPQPLVQQLLPELWLALCAAYVSVGAPALINYQSLVDQLDQTNLAEDWPAVLALAVNSNNDHLIKMTYSCHQENLQYPSPLYFATAQRLLQGG